MVCSVSKSDFVHESFVSDQDALKCAFRQRVRERRLSAQQYFAKRSVVEKKNVVWMMVKLLLVTVTLIAVAIAMWGTLTSWHWVRSRETSMVN